mgnify:CR=1 FL=1
MKTGIRILILAVVAFSLSSCKLFRKPTVEKIRDIQVVSISPDKSVVRVSLIVNNPNCAHQIQGECQSRQAKYLNNFNYIGAKRRPNNWEGTHPEIDGE